MTEREKVIYSIERCTCHVPDACRDCAYDAGHPYNECVEMMLKDTLSLLKAQESGWISVKDRLPDKAGIYIIVDHYGIVRSRHFCKSDRKFAGYWHSNGSAYYGNPTHWMPLPEPPKEG